MALNDMVVASELLIMRTAIAARMQEALLGLNVEEFPRSQLTTEDLDAALKNRNVAVRVSLVGIPPDSDFNSNEVDAPCVWAVFVTAKDIANGLPRDKIVLGLLPTILRTAARGNWTASGAENEIDEQKVEKLGARQMYPGEVDTKSACLWVVEWHQRISLKPPLPDDLREFITLITHYDVVPADGEFEATDVIQMRGSTQVVTDQDEVLATDTGLNLVEG